MAMSTPHQPDPTRRAYEDAAFGPMPIVSVTPSPPAPPPAEYSSAALPSRGSKAARRREPSRQGRRGNRKQTRWLNHQLLLGHLRRAMYESGEELTDTDGELEDHGHERQRVSIWARLSADVDLLDLFLRCKEDTYIRKRQREREAAKGHHHPGEGRGGSSIEQRIEKTIHKTFHHMKRLLEDGQGGFVERFLGAVEHVLIQFARDKRGERDGGAVDKANAVEWQPGKGFVDLTDVSMMSSVQQEYADRYPEALMLWGLDGLQRKLTHNLASLYVFYTHSDRAREVCQQDDDQGQEGGDVDSKPQQNRRRKNRNNVAKPAGTSSPTHGSTTLQLPGTTTTTPTTIPPQRASRRQRRLDAAADALGQGKVLIVECYANRQPFVPPFSITDHLFKPGDAAAVRPRRSARNKDAQADEGGAGAAPRASHYANPHQYGGWTDPEQCDDDVTEGEGDAAPMTARERPAWAVVNRVCSEPLDLRSEPPPENSAPPSVVPSPVQVPSPPPAMEENIPEIDTEVQMVDLEAGGPLHDPFMPADIIQRAAENLSSKSSGSKSTKTSDQPVPVGCDSGSEGAQPTGWSLTLHKRRLAADAAERRASASKEGEGEGERGRGRHERD
ncbi:unnamed protein product [Vitrella brassicaformis CCMP3155]|uniref:Uncharacterized protein n=3 Tax=Vitrella brassicaformis TaxID=1169539 RepID=A0A0G4ERL4_VITBC|nr:unnamed protein product [Vitrella brassicaformis CCMP3155]|eukprot:CEM00477.1 unnamed protein product [Vitrella brassicaformis CCMP3155]